MLSVLHSVPRGPRARAVPFALACAVAVLVSAGRPGTAAAQFSLPDVDIALVVQVEDLSGWLSLHSEVLGTPKESPKLLGVTLPAGTGGRRSITVMQPKFHAELNLTQGSRSLKLVVSGKVSGAEALHGLPLFEHAVLEVQAGVVENQLSLVYGLSEITGQLLELHLARS